MTKRKDPETPEEKLMKLYQDGHVKLGRKIALHQSIQSTNPVTRDLAVKAVEEKFKFHYKLTSPEKSG
jgi:hypothetical protein